MKASPPAGLINAEIPTATCDPIDQRRVRLDESHPLDRSARRLGHGWPFGGGLAGRISMWRRKGHVLVLNLAALWAWQRREKSKLS
jgi:hypothetical protein